MSSDVYLGVTITASIYAVLLVAFALIWRRRL